MALRITPVNEGMPIDAVDEADNPIRMIVREDVFRVHANFRVAHVLVFNSRGYLLIQRLALKRARHPGYWGSSVAAYVFSHEDYRSAASRRLSEELGIHDPKVDFICKTSMQDEGCRKFIGVFSSLQEGPFRFDHQHIDQLEFRSLMEIRHMIASGIRSFTPTFLHVMQSYEETMFSAHT